MNVTSLLACPFCKDALSQREAMGIAISIFLMLGLLYGLASLVVRAVIKEEKARAVREAALLRSGSGGQARAQAVTSPR